MTPVTRPLKPPKKGRDPQIEKHCTLARSSCPARLPDNFRILERRALVQMSLRKHSRCGFCFFIVSKFESPSHLAQRILLLYQGRPKRGIPASKSRVGDEGLVSQIFKFSL